MDLSVLQAEAEKPMVVIGIHGLANKPPRDEKKQWWTKAIREGLRRNCARDAEDFEFEFVYWADLRYDDPLAPDENLEPYVPADGEGPFPRHRERDETLWLKIKTAVYETIGEAEKATDIRIVDDALLEYQFDDLQFYHENSAFCADTRRLLHDKIQEFKDHRIMLVAHSMGSVIAYDCLRLSENDEDAPQIEHLLTVGSPLGLLAIKDKIEKEHGDARVPKTLRRWTNHYDKGDVVAVASHLSENYKPNAAGVAVQDVIVENAYLRPDGSENHHKSYGYLRTPEFSEAVDAFLTGAAAPRELELDSD